MATVPAVRNDAALIEQVVLNGDLAQLTPEARVSYYNEVCTSLGLNPLTQPFSYIKLNNKLTLYAKRDATDQLRKIHNVSVSIVDRHKMEDVYVVTARATLPNGRVDEAIGAVNIQGLKGEALANALMKSETKGKRRVTLSIVGLGWLDETEVASIQDAKPYVEPALPSKPIDHAEVISEEQMQRLISELDKRDVDIDKLYEYYQIKHISKLPASHFEDCLWKLEKKPMRKELVPA